jgi:hypothetical protein
MASPAWRSGCGRRDGPHDVGPDGNADVFVGRFDSHMRVIGLSNITRSDIWESSPRWGTAPLLP